MLNTQKIIQEIEESVLDLIEENRRLKMRLNQVLRNQPVKTLEVATEERQHERDNENWPLSSALEKIDVPF